MNIQKNKIKQIATPSLLLLLLQTATIHYSYGKLLQNNCLLTCCIILIAALMLLPFICFSSMPLQLYSFKKNIVHLTLLLVIAATFCLYNYHHVLSSIYIEPQSVSNPPPAIYLGTITDVIYKRYSNEIYITFDQVNKTQESFKAMGHAAHGIDINNHDRIALYSTPVKLLTGKAPTPYELSLFRKGISHKIHLSPRNFSVIKKYPVTLRKKIRLELIKKSDALFRPEVAAFMKALYFGNKYFISKKILHYFKKAGVVHVLAASGLHVCIVSALPLLLLGLFKIDKRIIFILTIGLLLFYLYLTDLPVSLMRAVIMFTVFVFQFLLFLEKNSFNTLFMSGIIILAIFPYELYNIGFHLSFGATLGILIFYDAFKTNLAYLPKILLNSLCLTFAAQVFVLPLVFLHMSEINLAGVIANIITIPLVSLFFSMAIVINLLSFLCFDLAHILAFLVNIVYDVNYLFVKNITQINGHFVIEKQSVLLVLFFILTLIPVIPYINKKKIFSSCILAGYIGAWIFLDSGRKNIGQESLRYQHSLGTTILHIKNNQALLYGPLPPIDAMQSIIKKLQIINCETIALYIDDPTYSSINKSSYLVKKTFISHCLLTSSFKMQAYTQRFFTILTADGIKLHITNNKHILTQNTINNKVLTTFGDRLLHKIGHTYK